MSSPAPAAAASAYQDVGPIQCDGNGSGNQQGVRISADNAIVISGNCEYVLTDCEITAPAQAVTVSGNGRLTLERCQVRAPTAFVASGNAEIGVKDSVVFGGKQATGNAEIQDLGGNQFNSQ